MAHATVVRRSMSLQQWGRLQVDRIDALLVRQRHPSRGWEVRLGQYHPDGYEWDDDFHPIAEGDFWGRPDGTAQFRADVPLPSELVGQPVWLEFLTGAEVLVQDHGRLVDGIDPNRSQMLLAACGEPGQHFQLQFDAYTRSAPDDMRHVKTRQFRGCVQQFHTPALLSLDGPAAALKYDLEILYRMAFGGSIDGEVRECCRNHFQAVLKCFPAYDCSTDELRAALPAIRDAVHTRLFDRQSAYGHRGKLACVAHSHLDVAYHWKVAQSVQKNARTCLIQLRLMDRHPEFRYAHSQAWTYETLERCYPDLFAEVKQRIAEGRWEIVGGMYVEPDCNVPSAEALVRQIVYGKRYFLERFGVEVDNCWLPDVFGNSAIMPQILKQGGIDYFVSNKMSTWNDTNLFPHNNFVWRGLDGSEVCACVPPVHFITWNDPNQLVDSWDAFLDKDVCDESLHMYGYGDGGSGVTDEMLEYYDRVRQIPGLPRLRLCSGREYLQRAFSGDTDRFARWDGELYLEMHRGTFTSKGVLKQLNRRAEFLAQETETLCALAALAGETYPAAALRDAWKLLLVNQFHDILPGSHTNAVYHEARAAYDDMSTAFATLEEHALARLAPAAKPRELCVFNPSSDRRRGLAVGDPEDECWQDAASLADAGGTLHPVQSQVLPGGGTRIVAALPEVPPFSITGLTATAEAPPHTAPLAASPERLENRFFRLDFDARRRLTGILDKRLDRQVLGEGAIGNEWQLFEDKPGNYNAWDILENYRDHPIALPEWDGLEVVEDGPLSAAVKLTRGFGNSRAEQIIRLYTDEPRIDFETWIDWQECEKLLKVAFPVRVRARFYTTDTSAGALERDNHRNTSWQQAQFEVCHHKWVDLSEGLFGVALMNDGRYGCDVRNNVLRLSLLKAPIRPDPVSDREVHRFTYSLFPHQGDWRRAGLVEAAYALNWPLRLRAGYCPRAGLPIPLTLDTPAVKCLAFKGDEDEGGDIVVRLAELYGAHVDATLDFGFPIAQATLCDLLERPNETLTVEGHRLVLPFRPYQIQTLRLRPGQG